MREEPNIVFLVNDHQAYYRHGWDSGIGPQRPAFNRLAAGGIRFDRAYTAVPLCLPARRTIATGMYPHNHGALSNDKMRESLLEDLYFGRLAGQGYRNVYVGKWHAGPGTAYDYGCEGYSYPLYGNPYVTDEYRAYLKQKELPVARFAIERRFWAELPESGEYTCEKPNWCNEHASGLMLTPRETHESFFLADMACNWLRELAVSDRPFALRVDFWGPHQPYFPAREFADLYDPEAIPEYGSFRDDLKQKPEVYKTERNIGIGKDGKLIQPNPLPWCEWQKVIARCYAHITMVDAAGGVILDALDRLGLAENTVVVWTADHGDALACHGGHFDKRSYMPEEVLRIPLAMRWPGRIEPGQVSQKLVSLIDIAPTFLDVAGTAFEHEANGRSLLPFCTGQTDAWREDLMCVTHGHKEDVEGRTIVTDRFKYTATRGQMHELYDLKVDPYEMNNLSDDPLYKDLLQNMQRRLRSWQQRTHDEEDVMG